LFGHALIPLKASCIDHQSAFLEQAKNIEEPVRELLPLFLE